MKPKLSLLNLFVPHLRSSPLHSALLRRSHSLAVAGVVHASNSPLLVVAWRTPH